MLVAEAVREVLLMLFIICLFFVFLLNSEAVNGDEILAFKLMKCHMSMQMDLWH